MRQCTLRQRLPVDGYQCRQDVRKRSPQASRVCSSNPAELLGLNKGVLEPGRDGDVLILDEKLDILYTIVAGMLVYQRWFYGEANRSEYNFAG